MRDSDTFGFHCCEVYGRTGCMGSIRVRNIRGNSEAGGLSCHQRKKTKRGGH